MRKLRIVMGALALAVVAATVFACTKEKETKVAQQATETEEVARKPIATYDNATGQMMYHVSVEQLQSAMDNFTASKSVGEVIVESWSIIDDEESGLPLTLSFVILDMETEYSTSLFLIQSFLNKEESEQGVDYYLSQDVESGRYAFLAHSGNGELNYVIRVENNTIVSVSELQEGEFLSSEPGWYVKCKARNCLAGCTLNQYNNCTKCQPDPDAGSNWYCDREEWTGTVVERMIPNLLSNL